MCSCSICHDASLCSGSGGCRGFRRSAGSFLGRFPLLLCYYTLGRRFLLLLLRLLLCCYALGRSCGLRCGSRRLLFLRLLLWSAGGAPARRRSAGRLRGRLCSRSLCAGRGARAGRLGARSICYVTALRLGRDVSVTVTRRRDSSYVYVTKTVPHPAAVLDPGARRVAIVHDGLCGANEPGGGGGALCSQQLRVTLPLCMQLAKPVRFGGNTRA
mmetsp:Transcript_21815/g.50789  ORF Transcript_21815/g.50789 Transcript_21815/m.50789 type:complete len:214 (+) Transcript_21815:700-1341(+)